MHRYHLSRGGKVLGIYAEDKMREYFAQGRVGANDLVWREGMDSWLPAWQVFGAETPQAVAPAPPPLPVGLPAEATAAAAAQPDAAVPAPPKLHWALVLLLSIATFGIFYIVWTFVQASWVRRIDPKSNATALMIVYLVLAIAGQVIAENNPDDPASNITGSLLVLAGWVVSFVAFFSMRRSMLNHYNQREPIGLRLSGLMTFFFNVLYFQHHMTRIARWKATGVMSSQ